MSEAARSSGSELEIDVLFEAGDWSAIKDVESLAMKAAATTLAAEGQKTAGLSILLSDDVAIRTLNATFRGQDKPTNVLSFPPSSMPGASATYLGDIALAYETCAREAEADGKTLRNHLAHLVVHGVLHLLGYDHESDPDAEAMEARERLILASLDIADPYSEPSGAIP
jgi:probable rRNA maturation factor